MIGFTGKVGWGWNTRVVNYILLYIQINTMQYTTNWYSIEKDRSCSRLNELQFPVTPNKDWLLWNCGGGEYDIQVWKKPEKEKKNIILGSRHQKTKTLLISSFWNNFLVAAIKIELF